jgi:hypothetical protein
MLIAIALTVIASMASFRWIETPFRRGPLVRHAQRGYLVFAGLACAFVFSSAVGFAEAHRGRLSLSVTERRATSWASPWWRVNGRHTPHCEALHSRTPLPNDAQVEEFRGMPCGNSSPANERPTRVFVSGNSHALAYEDMFDHLAATEPFVVEEHFKNECSLFSLGAPLSRSGPGCYAFFLTTLAHVRASARPGDILFLPSLRLPRLSDQWGIGAGPATDFPASLRALDAQRARDAAREEAAKLLQPIVAAGVRVIFEAPKPVFRAPSYRCSDWFNKENPVCAPGLEISRDYIQRLREPILASMDRLADELPGIFVWDPLDVLCPGVTCKAVVDGKPLFVDGDHVSDHANQVLYPSFLAFLRRVQNSPVRLAANDPHGAGGR